MFEVCSAPPCIPRVTKSTHASTSLLLDKLVMFFLKTGEIPLKEPTSLINSMNSLQIPHLIVRKCCSRPWDGNSPLLVYTQPDPASWLSGRREKAVFGIDLTELSQSLKSRLVLLAQSSQTTAQLAPPAPCGNEVSPRCSTQHNILLNSPRKSTGQ